MVSVFIHHTAHQGNCYTGTIWFIHAAHTNKHKAMYYSNLHASPSGEKKRPQMNWNLFQGKYIFIFSMIYGYRRKKVWLYLSISPQLRASAFFLLRSKEKGFKKALTRKSFPIIIFFLNHQFNFCGINHFEIIFFFLNSPQHWFLLYIKIISLFIKEKSRIIIIASLSHKMIKKYLTPISGCFTRRVACQSNLFYVHHTVLSQ